MQGRRPGSSVPSRLLSADVGHWLLSRPSRTLTRPRTSPADRPSFDEILTTINDLRQAAVAAGLDWVPVHTQQ